MATFLLIFVGIAWQRAIRWWNLCGMRPQEDRLQICNYI
jgi:hypothetical protein